MTEMTYDAMVIGGGPGGYVCAIRAAQLGLKAVLIEQNALGGTCLNVGCIPSKALIHVADTYHHLVENQGHCQIGLSCTDPNLDFSKSIAWKDGVVSRLTDGVESLLKRAGVKVLAGKAQFYDGKTVNVVQGDATRRIKAKNTIIATGSSPVALPGLPIGGRIIGSTEALELDDVPDRLVVVGAGYIGLELGTAFAKLGSQVEIVEASASILPQYDRALVAPIAARLNKLGVKIRTGVTIIQVSDDGVVSFADGAETSADYVLLTVGRTANTEGFGLETLGLNMNGRFIAIDNMCQTSMTGVYAIGDVTGEPLLAHRAMAQGDMVAELLAGWRKSWDDPIVPEVCFTDPEIVSVGLSPEVAKTKGIDIIEGQFPFMANGRMLSQERDDGFVRVIAQRNDHVLLGIQAVGKGIAELSYAFSVAVEMGARLEDIADIIGAHPTVSEGFQEAAMKALGRGLHV